MLGVPIGGTQYASFLLRLWRSDAPEGTAPPKPGWQGEVEHLQTRQRWTFGSLEELLRMLHHQLEEAGSRTQE
jgi:hypothetical protein